MEQWEGKELNEAKRILAYEVTKLVHGEEEAEKVKAAAEAVFAGGGVSADMPTTVIADVVGKGVLDVADALVKEGIEPEVFLYPADRHEILNEDDNEKVYADVLTFVKGIVDGITSES